MTWPFSTWQTGDVSNGTQPPDNTRGIALQWGPDVTLPAVHPSATVQPFTDRLLLIGSFLLRNGWSNTTTGGHGMFSIGVRANDLLAWAVIGGGASARRLQLFASRGSTTYDIRLGDEDGSSWLQVDKWYQYGVMMTGTEITYAINGTTTPKLTIATNSPKALILNPGNESVTYQSPNANAGDNYDPISAMPSSNYPSLLFGPCLIDSETTLNFNDTATRDRIWDTDGNFKFPGKNGSLWLGDSYNDVRPDYYFANGSAWHNYGTYNDGDIALFSANGSQFTGHPGGFRGQYE